MTRIALVLAVILTAGTAAASDKTDVMASVNQFIDGFNKGDVKSAVAACASPVSIVDEFPPYAWQGPAACSDWANDFLANATKNAISDSVVTLGKPRHLDLAGDRAYVVAPADYKYKLKGKATVQKGATMTLALQKTADGWRITGWSWSTGK
jgi:ketosteroid isomerase-like protein